MDGVRVTTRSLEGNRASHNLYSEVTLKDGYGKGHVEPLASETAPGIFVTTYLKVVCGRQQRVRV